MRIQKFSVEALHGFLDLEILFNEDLTIIVGRNGSGKTSALTLISDLLRLDVAAIRRVQFKSATLNLQDHILGNVTISARNANDAPTLSIEAAGKEARFPLDISAELWASTRLKSAMSLAGITKALSLSHNSPVMQELPPSIELANWAELSQSISKQVSLSFVRLDRTIVAINSDGTERTEGPLSKPGPGSPDAIEEIIKVTTRRYGEYKKRIEDIKSKTFSKLLALHFDSITGASRPIRTSQAQLKSKLIKLRRRVEESALFSDSEFDRANAESFFSSFLKLIESPANPSGTKKAGRRTLDEEYFQLLLNLKEQQIDKLLKIFDEEQTLAQEAIAPIKKYLDACMKFLRESGKQLEFDASLQLGFYVKQQMGMQVDQRLRSLKELASGERQVVIVLAYLAFLSGNQSIFIIDEPELSLHLRWQSYLVEALTQLRPSGCQIVVATHAPEIAGRARSKLKLLSPSYLPKEVG